MQTKAIGILVGVLIVAAGVYYVFGRAIPQTVVPMPPSEVDTVITYMNQELGIGFDYRTGPKGYVLTERPSSEEGPEPIHTLILMQAADAEAEMPVGGEGPPAITISIFKNAKKQWPQTWANEYIQYSNINLMQNEIQEAVVGGANAIRYMSDGLYASENIVVAHGEHMYVFTGMFIDAESQLRKDFAPLVESVRFVPQPGQQ